MANMITSGNSSPVPVPRDSGKGGKKPKHTNDIQGDNDNNNHNSQVVSTTLSVKPNTNQKALRERRPPPSSQTEK